MFYICISLLYFMDTNDLSIDLGEHYSGSEDGLSLKRMLWVVMLRMATDIPTTVNVGEEEE